MKNRIDFYFLLFKELILLPFLYIKELYIKQRKQSGIYKKYREAVKMKKVSVGIHEWGGYKPVRMKNIKNGTSFQCGLLGQLQRFSKYGYVDLIVTLSDCEKFSYYDVVSEYTDKVVKVSNKGFDFSGYDAFYQLVKDQPNQYVILTNSSVNLSQDDFLDGYIQYMEENPDVGLLGVSYCTCMWQTLVRNNFTPHLQSFFLLTTTQVLNEVVALNKGKFPGKGINHKLLLIRQGEIKLSRLVQKLGYRLAVVNPQNGIPFKFTDYRHWKLPKGDIRQLLSDPNKITPISI